MTNKTLNTIIIGAGIGGLATALCLAKKGLKSEIYEKTPELSELGAGVQLSPNATKVLNYLGLLSELRKYTFEPQAFKFLNYKNKNIIAEQNLGEEIEKKYGAPNYDVHRADLQKVLLEEVKKQGIKIHTNSVVHDVNQDETSAYIHTNEGIVKGDLVIGADGIHSLVRKKLWGDDKARFTGNVAWRMLVPVDHLPPNLLQPNTTIWLGPNKHFVQYHVKNGTMLNCVCLVEQEGWTNENWAERGEIEELKELYKGWHDSLQTLLEYSNPESLYRWALHDRLPLKQWSKKRITLLGDSAHPMLPFLAQGAAMAIEDGAVLASSLSSFSDCKLGLIDYESKRKIRTTMVQKMAARNAKIFHLSGVSAVMRNLVMNFAGKRIMNELYNYDAIDI